MADEIKQAAAPSAAPSTGGGGHSGGGHSGGGHSGPRREGGPGGGHGGPRRDAGPGGPGGGPGGPRRGKRQYFRKKKVCKFCVEKMDMIDYKRADILSQFVQERGKILPRRMTGRLLAASALAGRGHQAGAQYCVAAVCRQRQRDATAARGCGGGGCAQGCRSCEAGRGCEGGRNPETSGNPGGC